MGDWDSYECAARAIEGARFEVVDFMRFNEKSDIWNFIPHSHNYYELILGGWGQSTCTGFRGSRCWVMTLLRTQLN